MKKKHFLHLHQLVYEAAKHDFQEHRELEEDVDKVLLEHSNLDVQPYDISAQKNEHKEALQTVLTSYTDIIENGVEGFHSRLLERDISTDTVIQILGEQYSEKGLTRQEASEKVAEEVEFAPRTVYDRFSDVDVSFGNTHGKQTREDALNDLQEMKDRGEREVVLEEVSEEYDVPRPTLKTWMNQKGITFDSPYSALLTEESKRELIETAEHYFDTRRNLDDMQQALDRDKDTLRAYKKGQIETMPVELLEQLDSLFESEPRYRMDDPNRYVEDRNGRGVKVEDSFQQFLFEHLTTDDFRGMTGKSTGSFNKYRNNKTERIDPEAYRKAFQAVSYMYSKHPEPEVEAVVDKNVYGTSSGDLEKAEVSMEEASELLAG